jgi:hypothetical protein
VETAEFTIGGLPSKEADSNYHLAAPSVKYKPPAFRCNRGKYLNCYGNLLTKAQATPPSGGRKPFCFSRKEA